MLNFFTKRFNMLPLFSRFSVGRAEVDPFRFSRFKVVGGFIVGGLREVGAEIGVGAGCNGGMEVPGVFWFEARRIRKNPPELPSRLGAAEADTERFLICEGDVASTDGMKGLGCRAPSEECNPTFWTAQSLH